MRIIDACCFLIGPAALKGPYDSSGFPVGCKSACLVDSNPSASTCFEIHFWSTNHTVANSPNCCSGSHSTAATCPSSGVSYYSYFSTLVLVLNSKQKLTSQSRTKLPQLLRLCLR